MASYWYKVLEQFMSLDLKFSGKVKSLFVELLALGMALSTFQTVEVSFSFSASTLTCAQGSDTACPQLRLRRQCQQISLQSFSALCCDLSAS